VALAKAPSGQKLILVVEDEDVLRSAMVRALQKIPGVRVLDAGSVIDALELLRECGADLLVTDLDLEDGSGVPIIARATCPVVVVTGQLGVFRERLRRFKDLRVREKPLPLPELVALCTDLLGPSTPGASGKQPPAPFGAADYIQLACMSQHSIVIEMLDTDALLGTVVIRDGEIWSARDAQGEGTDALRRLLFNPKARASVYGLDKLQVGNSNISGGWQQVLLDAARIHDEEDEQKAHAEKATAHEALLGPPPTPPPPAPPAVSPPPFERTPTLNRAITPIPVPSHEPDSRFELPLEPAPPDEAGFEALMEHAVEALLKRRFADAHRMFTAAAKLRPNDPRIKDNLARLTRFGFGR
jgi:CheY-like chemotaxis protein